MLPLAQLSASWFHAMIGLGLGADLLWLPVILLPLLPFTTGSGWFLATQPFFFWFLMAALWTTIDRTARRVEMPTENLRLISVWPAEAAPAPAGLPAKQNVSPP